MDAILSISQLNPGPLNKGRRPVTRICSFATGRAAWLVRLAHGVPRFFPVPFNRCDHA